MPSFGPWGWTAERLRLAPVATAAPDDEPGRSSLPGGAPAVLIGGPTASGKSPLALALARRLDGVVINADAMQVYRDLRILTARPSREARSAAPHRLFGHVDGARRHSVAAWLVAARRAAREARSAGRLPILVGGSGLYLAAFAEGLSPIPEIPPACRAGIDRRMEEEGCAALYRELMRLDPETAERLAAGDRRRVGRALEVLAATGRPLSFWLGLPRRGGWPGPLRRVWLDPERAALRAACDRRFDAMLAAGALDEVRGLAARGLGGDRPVMRALGVPSLLDHLAGRRSLAEAEAEAKAATRRYAKRQVTWFRHRTPRACRYRGFGGPEAARHLLRFVLTPPSSAA